MHLFEAILVMLALAVPLMAAARRWHLPYPVLIAGAGMAIAMSPLDTDVAVDPALILALFVAPVLLDAAFDTSFRDLKRNWRPIMSLALIAVGLTTATVALVVHLLVPTIPWAAAVAIGAIVAPPDAVAATTVLRGLKLPLRIATILEGEALLNDASTLLIYRLSVGAVATGGSLGTAAIAPAFLLSLVGSIVVGPVLGYAMRWIIGRVTDVPGSTILQFVSTFGVWVLAEAIGLSPILTLVAYAITIARSTPIDQAARMRVPSYAVWDTAVVVLNVLAFMLIGLELGPVMLDANAGQVERWLLVAAAVLATVIVVRLVWTLFAAAWSRWRMAERMKGPVPPDWRTGLLVGWAGSRGIVTVATALALPADFPERGMMLLVAVGVTLGTLLLQGATLRPLVVALQIPSDDIVDREIRFARAALSDAALVALEGERTKGVEVLRDELGIEKHEAEAAKDGDGRPVMPIKEVRARMINAKRHRLFDLRRDGKIGDQAFHVLEEELDLSDLAIAKRT